MRLLAHLLMKLFVLIVQFSVSYLFEMTIIVNIIKGFADLQRSLQNKWASNPLVLYAFIPALHGLPLECGTSRLLVKFCDDLCLLLPFLKCTLLVIPRVRISLARLLLWLLSRIKFRPCWGRV